MAGEEEGKHAAENLMLAPDTQQTQALLDVWSGERDGKCPSSCIYSMACFLLFSQCITTHYGAGQGDSDSKWRWGDPLCGLPSFSKRTQAQIKLLLAGWGKHLKVSNFIKGKARNSPPSYCDPLVWLIRNIPRHLVVEDVLSPLFIIVQPLSLVV